MVKWLSCWKLPRHHHEKTALLLSFLAFSLHANAELRTFTCAEGERTFDGRLTAFNSDTKTVSVINTNGQSVHFDLSLLSQKDQEYVQKKAPTLPVNVSLDVRFEQLRDRQEADRNGRTRRTTYDGGYNITIRDFSGNGLQNAEIEYLLIYRKDEVNGSGENQTVKGRKTFSVEPNGSHEVETETVQLVNLFQRGQVQTSGGCSGRSCGARSTATRSQRSRDFLVGCIDQIKINGVVVETVATAPNLLRTYAEELSGSAGDTYTSR